jgi:lysophospholipase L1-like esterase
MRGRRTAVEGRFKAACGAVGLTAGLLAALILGSGAVGALSATPAAAAAPAEYYLDLGGSASVGFQPTAARPDGQPTDSGYANDLLPIERARWRDLQLVQFGCPGETTASFLYGGDRCRPAGQTQMGEALDFLHLHPGTVLVTLDLGFNDIHGCFSFHVVDPDCLAQRLALVRQQLPQIVSALRAAGGPDLEMVGLGHFDPYLGDWVHGGANQTFAEASVAAVDRLDTTLRTIYAASDVPMAEVGRAFQIDQTNPTPLNGDGDVPQNVARTCTLTWACTSAPRTAKQHPNNLGYQVIAQAIAAVVPS